MLTYTKIVTHREEVECTLEPYKHWGMFTPQGNKRLKKIASDLIEDLEKAESYEQNVKALIKYKKKWVKMCDYKSYGEASDTAVREVVWSFMMKAGDAVGMRSYTVEDIWDSVPSW